jgi:hypothetical protein
MDIKSDRMKSRREGRDKTQSYLDASVFRSCSQYDHWMNVVTKPDQALKFSASKGIPNNTNNKPNKRTKYESNKTLE